MDRSAQHAALLVPLAMLGGLGCSPTYSPLVRAVSYGAPGRIQEGQIELTAGIAGRDIPEAGGPELAVAVKDWLSVEAGGNIDKDEWAMGFGGLRFTYAPAESRRNPIRFAMDLEFGLGGGIGGHRCGNKEAGDTSCDDAPEGFAADGKKWSDRLSWGAYEGVGVGGHFYWYSLYLRARMQHSVATNVPWTHWPSATLGMDFNILDRVYLSGGFGWMMYFNDVDNESGFTYQFAMTVPLRAWAPTSTPDPELPPP